MQQGRVNLCATNVTGTAFGTEVYIHVRWLWATLPTFTLIGSIAILIITILSSNKRSYLFKHKVLAAIFVQLDGWKTNEYTL
jgi:hypothetical protein